MSNDFYSCGCKGTVHDPHCSYWKQATQPVYTNAPEKVYPEWDVMRKLDRIIELLEEIAKRR